MSSMLSNSLPRVFARCVQRAAPSLGTCTPTQHSTTALRRLWIRKICKHTTATQTLRVRTAAVECEAVDEDVARPRKAFKFKKFQVYHDKCSHKVGTDGCLLAAWVAQHVTVPTGANILDVGTGSGVIALMLAQAFEGAGITGVDIDASSYEQAVENFHHSPFSRHLKACHCSLQDHTASIPAASYSLLVSNPPYYIQGQSARSPHGNRAPARQNYLLPFHDLLTCSAKLLVDHGLLCVILPPIEAATFVHEAQNLNTFSLMHTVRVRTRQQDGRKGDTDKRHILLMHRQARECGPESGHGASLALSAVGTDLGDVSKREQCGAAVERPSSGAAVTAAVASAGVVGSTTGTVGAAGTTGVTAVGRTAGMVGTAGSTGVTAVGSTTGTVVTAGPAQYTAGDRIPQTSSAESLIYIHSQGTDYSPEFVAILKNYLIIF